MTAVKKTDSGEIGGHTEELNSVTLGEWSEVGPISLSERDVEFIEQRINADTEMLGIEHTADGRALVSSSRYVGIAALPDGPTIEVIPKSAGENFVALFQYAQGVDAQTIQQRTDVRGGPAFLDALAALYVDELATIHQHGLARAYHRISDTEEYLRGQLDIQRQLQRQRTTVTQFECTYDELTADTTANQGLLYAGLLLERVVRDEDVHQQLERQLTRFRREVSVQPIRPHEFSEIEVTRLNEYYRDALRLAELIIRNVYVEELRTGNRGSYGLFINMDTIFEEIVERAFREAVLRNSDWEGWQVEGQAHVTGLVTGGSPRVRMRPDFVVRNAVEEVVFTGDAKWKTDRVRQNDIYQLTAYQLADDVPGALVYPGQNGAVSTEYMVQDTYPLQVHELPTATEVDDYSELCTDLEDSAESVLQNVI
jgi:5-methylcytosine-specific restriction enzyme subunit McrC